MDGNNFDKEYWAAQNNEPVNSYEYQAWDDDDYQRPQSNGLAITGMVLGIVSVLIVTLLFCCAGPWGGLLALPLSVAGLIVSIKALKKEQSRGMCITGIVCSAIALFISCIYVIVDIAAIIIVFMDTFDYYTF